MSPIQLPTLEDLLLWACSKPQMAPIGLIESESYCPIARYLSEHDEDQERVWHVTKEYITYGYPIDYGKEEEQFSLPDHLRQVISLVDAYGPYAKDNEIPAASFIHILQTVAKAFSVDPSCE